VLGLQDQHVGIRAVGVGIVQIVAVVHGCGSLRAFFFIIA
jgi:hypothetical protein